MPPPGHPPDPAIQPTVSHAPGTGTRISYDQCHVGNPVSISQAILHCHAFYVNHLTSPKTP